MENLIKIMIDPRHGLHSLLPETVNQIRQRQTRSNGEKLYNFRYRTEVTERFKNSPIVHGIESFNPRLELISRSKFVDPFKTFFKLKITCKYTFNVNLS